MLIDITFFILITFSVHFSVSRKYYNNFTLFRVTPVDETQIKYLKDLTRNDNVNFWTSPSVLYKSVDFVISSEAKLIFLKDAQRIDLYYTEIMEDVQKAFDKQIVQKYIRTKAGTFNWQNYYRLNDIYMWLKDLQKFHPQEMTVLSIGKTHEGRDIMAVKIILKGSKRRSKVLIEGGIHAREWIAPTFVTYMINKILLAPYIDNTALKEIALTYEWYFVPVLNPDGYEYSHVMDRLWRKNRNGTYGVDLNRNFNYTFGTMDSSADMNSESHCGPHAFSEKETTAMRSFVRSLSANLEYYLAFHSYGQYMIIPYMDTKDYMDNFKDVKKMCIETRELMAAKYKTFYKIGTAYDTVGYFASGTSCCWVKKDFRVPYALTFELRDEGEFGFALPPELILPTCVETLDGLLALLRPRTTEFKKLSPPIPMKESSGDNVILDKILIVFKLFSLIILCIY